VLINTVEIVGGDKRLTVNVNTLLGIVVLIIVTKPLWVLRGLLCIAQIAMYAMK
jgi:hypothetical protein